MGTLDDGTDDRISGIPIVEIKDSKVTNPKLGALGENVKGSVTRKWDRGVPNEIFHRKGCQLAPTKR
jgi:hypothetical protein